MITGHDKLNSVASDRGLSRWLVLLTVLCVLRLSVAGAVTERWVYKPTNLLVDERAEDVVALLERSARCGVTHLLLTDSKFARLGDLPERYFRNAARVRETAARLGVEIVPTVCPVGYSNDLLMSNAHLIEGIQVKDVPLTVRNGVAVVEGREPLVKGGDFASWAGWGFHDECVELADGALRMRDPDGKNARIFQKIRLEPWRQYHVRVKVRTVDFHGTPEVKVLAGDRSLSWDYLKVKSSQDWTVQDVVFHSMEFTEATLILGCWGGGKGELWWDDCEGEETAFVNLVRRPGAPLTVKDAGGHVLVEGRDFDAMPNKDFGMKPYGGCYEVYETPPVLRTALPEGTRLTVSCTHGVTVHDGQACLCPSEPESVRLMEDMARRVNELWHPKSFMMSHDEIRVWNQCAACQARGLTAGQLLADNVRQCVAMLRRVSPEARICVWSDMFDPHHNAHGDYYLVNGDYSGSWEGLDKAVTILPWNVDTATKSLAFFGERGHAMILAGYYDDRPQQVQRWLEAARPWPTVQGVMYTTWQNQYADLEAFFGFVPGPGKQ